jgi:jasmonate O-methyltransferase
LEQGLVEKEKMSSFFLPYYAPSVDEVKALIEEEEELFDIEHTGLFESNWDPLDDSDSDVVLDCASSGRNVANKSIRAVIEPLIINHFGEAILDELFMVFATMVAKHLEIGKAKYPVIVVSLKKVMH